jgi:hypothetical protein
MYDSLEDKPVHYVSRRPVEYNCIVDPAGDKVKVECTLNVLSSQHEGAHFRLRFSAASLALQVLSDPIRVVSKQLQLKKVKEQRKLAAASEANKRATAAAAASKKRPLAETTSTIQDTLARIEAQQQTQQTLITSLFQTVMAQLPLAATSPTTPALATASSSPVSSPFAASSSSSAAASPSVIFAQPQQPPTKRRRLDSTSTSTSSPWASRPSTPSTDYCSPQATFESHLRGLVESYHALSPNTRVQTVGAVVKSAPVVHTEKLAELLDVLCAEGLGRTSNITLGGSTAQLRRSFSVAGADASDCDDDYYANSETWLSTETTPATSPMSPGQNPSAGSTFSFNVIGLEDTTTTAATTTSTLCAEFDDTDYSELFSGQGWLLDEGDYRSSF